MRERTIAGSWLLLSLGVIAWILMTRTGFWWLALAAVIGLLIVGPAFKHAVLGISIDDQSRQDLEKRRAEVLAMPEGREKETELAALVTADQLFKRPCECCGGKPSAAASLLLSPPGTIATLCCSCATVLHWVRVEGVLELSGEEDARECTSTARARIEAEAHRFPKDQIQLLLNLLNARGSDTSPT
jgi:hypothetical protein